MYGYVYKSYCKITDKFYIGSKKSDKFIINYFGSGNLIKEALEIYNIEDFEVELIEECSSKEELEEREKYWMEYYNAIESSKFYNIAFTSNRNDGHKNSEYQKLKQSRKQKGNKMSNETKSKISNTLKYLHKNGVKFAHNEYKSHNISVEGRKKMSEATKKAWENGTLGKGKNASFYGKHHSDETKKKISESRKGLKPSDETRKLYSQQRKGRIYVNNGIKDKIIWPGQLEEYEKLGFKKGRLSSPIKGKKKNKEGKWVDNSGI